MARLVDAMLRDIQEFVIARCNPHQQLRWVPALKAADERMVVVEELRAENATLRAELDALREGATEKKPAAAGKR